MTKTAENKIFDVAIIGGGSAGAGIAREAALRGLTVILFEKNEFGSGTSSKTSRLIHGGIRYLEISADAFVRRDFKEAWKNLRFVFSALRECKTLERIAPDTVKPLPLFIPVYDSDRRGLCAVLAGALFYSLLSCLAGNFKPVKMFWRGSSLLKKIPELKTQGLLGGIRIWDHVTDDRALVQKTIASAIALGAECFEHAQALGDDYRFNEDCHEIRVRIQDELRVFRTRKLINASGPWVDQVRKSLGEDAESENLIAPIAGSHLMMKRFLPSSVILQAHDGRIFFVINHGEHCRIGTTEWRCDNPDEVRPTTEDTEYLLKSLSVYFPSKPWSEKDILSSDAGIRPLAAPKNNQNPNQISREHEIRVGESGIIHVLGVKLTDHRRAAEEIVGEMIPQLRRHKPNLSSRSVSSRRPLNT